MELDDLKKAWKQDENENLQTQNIMELIHQKSRGPIASLKNSFKRQMLAISTLLVVVLATNSRYIETVPAYILLFTYVAFCLSVILALFLNYRLTGKLESMDGNVKTNLEAYVTMLDRRLKWQYIGSRLVVVVLIILVELLPLFYHARMLDKWHSVSPFIRFPAYAAYLLFVYFMSRKVKERKFGRHLTHLRELLKEMK